MASYCLPQQVAIIEFEVNQMGFWSPGTQERRTVRAIFELLTSAGYECFWEQDDALLPASGQCFDAQLDTARSLKWSNVVCAHEPEVIGVLDAMAQEAYRKRVAKATRAADGAGEAAGGAAGKAHTPSPPAGARAGRRRRSELG